MRATRCISVGCTGALLLGGLGLGLLSTWDVSVGAAALAAKNVYVANTVGSPGIVAQYSVGAGDSLSPLTPATVAAGTVPVEVAVTPNGANVYVVSFSDVVSQYTVDPTSGGLVPMTPATVATGSIPTAITTSPNGHNAYVTNDGNNDVSQYAIDPVTGALAPLNPPTVGAGDEPSDVVVSPDGRTAYVTNASDNTIWQYDVNPVTGALSPMSPPSVLGGGGPRAIALTPDGQHAYVTNSNQGDNDVSQFNLSPVSGALTPMTPATVAAGPQPEGIALNPNGTSAYVANVDGGAANPGGGSISQYNIDPVTGALSPKTPASVPSANPIDVVVAPDSGTAYVTNYITSGAISEYNIDPASGVLSLRTAVPSEGGDPEGIAVRSVPSASIKTVTSLTSSPDPAVVNQGVTYKARVNSVPPGSRTPSGTLTFSDGGAPISGCAGMTLSAGQAKCTVSYRTTGSHAIVASYGGDSDFTASTSTELGETVMSCLFNRFWCDLIDANLVNADLSGQVFGTTDANRGDLSGADLEGSVFFIATLAQSNLSGANLHNAKLLFVDLSGANLTNADLSGAVTFWVNFARVTWSNTVCPDGTNSNADSGTCIGHL
jgi:6-phosphogluconolactonase (cycloisomerase 2 family)